MDTSEVKEQVKIRVATWNIGGGLIKSRSGTYDEENLPYFVSSLKLADCDVVCLQEAHTPQSGGDYGQIASIARGLSYLGIRCAPLSQSHLKAGACLAIGIICRFPVVRSEFFKIRNPELEAVGPDGRPWHTFDKGFLVCDLEIDQQPLCVITGHGHPFKYFGRDALDPEFSDINKSIDELIVEKSSSKKCIVAADLNYGRPDKLFPQTFAHGFRAAFTGVPSVPGTDQWDHILYSTGIELANFHVAKGLADHFLCTSDFVLLP